jgi:hypothetical protein
VKKSLVIAAALAASAFALPASASLIGTTASTSSAQFDPTPTSATVVDGGAPEFEYPDFFFGDVGATSFTLTSIGQPGFFGSLGNPANAISLTLAQEITGITVTIGNSIPTLPASVFTFSGNTLNIALGAAGVFEGGSLVARVDFTFAGGGEVSEPATLALLGAGLLGLAAVRRRQSA